MMAATPDSIARLSSARRLQQVSGNGSTSKDERAGIGVGSTSELSWLATGGSGDLSWDWWASHGC